MEKALALRLACMTSGKFKCGLSTGASVNCRVQPSSERTIALEQPASLQHRSGACIIPHVFGLLLGCIGGI
jgi:hypothetical protein